MKKNKGITLISLVVTIIVLLILAGITLNLVLREDGIFNMAKEGKEEYSKVAAKEKLELILLDFQSKKAMNEVYEEEELNKALQDQNMEVEDNLVIADGWQFEIDRSVPKIVADLEKLTPEEMRKATIKSIETIVGETQVEVKITIRNQEGAQIVYKINEIKENGEKENVETTNNLEVLEYIFKNLKPSTKYEVVIETSNAYGIASKKVEIETKTPILVERIILEKTEEKVGINHPKTIQYRIEPENATNKNIKWETSNSQVATVANGIITATKTGDCSITLTAEDGGGASATCQIKVANGISTVEELQAIELDMQKGIVESYILLNDIDLTGVKWRALGRDIANSPSFKGKLDGDGFSIINLSDTLFYGAEGVTIENIKFENVLINDERSYKTAVIGRLVGNLVMRNIGVTGSITGKQNIASLVGETWNSNTILIENCYSHATVRSTMGNCWSGLIYGIDQYSNLTITNCYYAGTIDSNSDWEDGSAIKNRVNSSSHYINDCYYDSNKYGRKVQSIYGRPLTTSQFANQNNFKNWDFENTWIMKDGYPELRIFVDK